MELLDRAQVLQLSPEDRRQYEYELKVYRDNYNTMEYAKAVATEEGLKEGFERGIKQGIEHGIEKGMKQGIEKGIERGIEQGKIEIIINGFTEGLSISLLAKITHFTEQEVLDILNNHNTK